MHYQTVKKFGMFYFYFR